MTGTDFNSLTSISPQLSGSAERASSIFSSENAFLIADAEEILPVISSELYSETTLCIVQGQTGLSVRFKALVYSRANILLGLFKNDISV